MIANESPRVSVVVPTFNRAELLERLLSALAECDAPVGGFEVVVVDDGSRDNTVEVVRAAELENVRYVQQPNAGAAAARNNGWRHARGDLIAFTDDDCVPSSRWLVDIVEAMDTRNCAAIGGKVIPLVPGFLASFVQAERMVGHGGDAESVKYLVTANAVFTRRTLELVGGFNERFPGAAGEDTDLTYRILDRDLPVTLVEDAVVAHDHRTTVRGLCKTYYRHGRARTILAGLHPGRGGEMRSRFVTPSYWRDRYRYYRNENATRGAATAYCGLRVVGLACFATGMATERWDERSARR